MDHHDERLELKSRAQLTAQAAMIKRGTAAQGVPVRQKRVAELDDDVAVLSSGQLEETKRDWSFWVKSLTRFRSENYAGEDSALCGKSSGTRSLLRKSLTKPQRAKSTRFLGSRWRSRRCRKNLESSRAHLGNLISDRSEFVSFTGTKTKRSRPFLINAQLFEKTEPHDRGG